jgi:putative membrane-bound dehydrogenase-like protein
MKTNVLVLAIHLAAMTPAAAQTVQHGIRVPAGFEVVEYADSRLANDIYCLTIDPKGRVVVAGRGYIRILVDDNDDGKADRAIAFADSPKDGAMGLLWEGDTLYVTGDGGLRRFTDRDGDDRADGRARLISAMKTGGEHAAHAIRRGPDGWLYVLCGNHAGIDASYATLPTSPIKEPVAGCVLRFSPELQNSEIVAHGFRNAYDMDFNSDGELFTYDSDNERCVSLPWYEPTRFYHVMPGADYGWMSPQRATFWRKPSYFFDVTPPVATLGRGSPTGVVCYRHAQFPKHYRGSFFLCDWTFGKVYRVPLERRGASYGGQPEVFLEAVGDAGFAPTSAAVHPRTGDLFISIGGRGTRGAVYRVRYPPGLGPELATEAAKVALPSRNLAWRERFVEVLPNMATSADVPTRLRGLQLVRRHYAHFGRVPWRPLELVIRDNWGHPDRAVRRNAADLLSLQGIQSWAVAEPWWKLATNNPARITAAAGLAVQPPPFGKLLELIQDASPELLADAVRVTQMHLGDIQPLAGQARGTVWEGYTLSFEPRNPPWIDWLAEALRKRYPSRNAGADREILRTLALMRVEAPAGLPQRWLESSDPVDDIHELIVWARTANKDRQTRPVATALLALDQKINQRKLNRDSHWPLRMAELYAGLAEKDPNLHARVVGHADFGRPDHALFAAAPGFDRARAAGMFLKRIQANPDDAVNEAVLQTLSALPAAEINPVVRPLWAKLGQDAALVMLLARQPEELDRAKFVASLGSPQVAVVAAALAALEKLPLAKDGDEILSLLRAWQQLPEQQKELRGALARRLTQLTELPAERGDKWSAWFIEQYPKLAPRLTNPDGVDLAAWQKRLARLDWSRADASRGQAVFAKANCSACHSGNQAIGPDLKGVTKRFSRPDLFAAILQPSKDVPARYQTTQAETRDGKVYQGTVIYDAVDSLILQTGATTTVRLAGAEVVSRQSVPRSLMPAGLLEPLTDDEIVDLVAYLQNM